MSQLSLFGSGAREPAVTDLEGLLAGPGHVAVRGDEARIGVVVHPGRADAMTRILARELEISAEVVEVTDTTSVAVRTPWMAELRPVATAWQQGALTLPPPGWVPDGPRLRWWCIAAGSAGTGDERMYTLSVAATNEAAWPAVGAALSAAGVAGVFVGPRADGPAYRVVGLRRLMRLRELVGEVPDPLTESDWPPRLDHVAL